MPVKVRCECGAGISAPDAARGKTIKCKQCGEPVRVPGRKKKAAKRKRAEPTPLDAHDEDFFDNIDMGRMEDMNVQVCPKCATEVDEDDIECPSCGVNLETGELSKKQKNLRKYKGPDPDEFYKVSWGNSFKFMKENMRILIGLCVFYALATSLFSGATVMAFFCEKKPLVIFWTAIAFICGVAPLGALWQVWIATIEATVDGKDVLKRFRFDFFTCVTLGIKAHAWPFALCLPLLLLVIWGAGVVGGVSGPATVQSNQNAIRIITGVIYFLPLVCYPVALSHMAAKYSFRAYLPVHMFRITFSNFGPVAWWFLMALALHAIGISTSIAAIVYQEEVRDFFSEKTLQVVESAGFEAATEALADLRDTANDQVAQGGRGARKARGFFYMVVGGVGLAFLFIVNLPRSIIICVPMFVLMRANGLFARYNARTLELGFKVEGLEPAGFWVRYLAFLIDLVVIGAFYVLALAGLYGLNWAAHALEMESVDRVKDCVFYGIFTAAAVIPFLYFLMEGGPSACTLGMRALGLMVIQEGRPRLQMNAILTRSAMRTAIILLSAAVPLVAVALIQAAWHKEKKAAHDVATKTNVVWRPENL